MGPVLEPLSLGLKTLLVLVSVLYTEVKPGPDKTMANVCGVISEG